MGLGSDELSKIMGRATLVNGFVAAAAGVCTSLRLLPPSFSLVYFYASHLLMLGYIIHHLVVVGLL